jgi:L-iditol 2-dehydrogenase
VVSGTFPIERWETAFDLATGRAGDFKVAIVF